MTVLVTNEMFSHHRDEQANIDMLSDKYMHILIH